MYRFPPLSSGCHVCPVHPMLVQFVLCPCHSAFEKGPARIETSGPEYFAISSLVTLVSKQCALFLCPILFSYRRHFVIHPRFRWLHETVEAVGLLVYMCLLKYIYIVLNLLQCTVSFSHQCSLKQHSVYYPWSPIHQFT